MSVKPLLCPLCGAKISLEKNQCEYCGVGYVVETGNFLVSETERLNVLNPLFYMLTSVTVASWIFVWNQSSRARLERYLKICRRDKHEV